MLLKNHPTNLPNIRSFENPAWGLILIGKLTLKSIDKI